VASHIKKRPHKVAKTLPENAKSLRELARRVNRSVSTVSAWLQRPDWPFPRMPPWHVAKVKAWSELVLSPNPAGAWEEAKKKVLDGQPHALGDLIKLKLQAEVQLLIEKVMAARTARDERANKLHDVANCRERRLRQIHTLKANLFDVARMLPPALEGKPRLDISRILKQRFASLCRTYAGDLAEVAEASEGTAP
jgi:hypothetical protein